MSGHQEAYSMGENQGKAGISEDRLFRVDMLGLPEVCNTEGGITER